MRALLQALPVGLLAALCSCAALEHEPWSQIGKGTRSVGASTGWAFYRATVEAEGTSGVLAPAGVPETGSDSTQLTAKYGGALKLNYFVTDRLSLGLIYELRRFEADPVSPLTAELAPEDFTTEHFLFSTRYWPDPFVEGGRWRPFLGLDLGYVPGVTFDNVGVTYPAATGIPSERVDLEGDSYWTFAPVAGVSYLLRDNLSFELGAFYEVAFTPSEDTLTLANLGGAQADVEVWPSGVIVFAGLTLYF